MQLKTLGGIVLTIVALAFSAASAEASGYYMTYGQAVAETKRYARNTCNELPECIAWGKGPCLRRSPSAFNCIAAFFYPGPGIEEGEELECNQILYWGVSRGGYIVLKNFSEPNCFYV